MIAFLAEKTEWESRCLQEPLPDDRAAATPEQRLAGMIAFVTCQQIDRLGLEGPYASAWIGDRFVVAALVEGEEKVRTELRQYTRDSLLAWYADALAYGEQFQDPDLTFSDALYETAPPACWPWS